MNLKELNELNTAKNEVMHEFELIHPATEEGLGIYLTAISPESDKPKKLMEKFANKLRREEVKENRTGKPSTFVEDFVEQGIAVQSACIVDWRGIEDDDGEPLEFSITALKAHVLSNLTFQVQIKAELDKVENFIEA